MAGIHSPFESHPPVEEKSFDGILNVYKPEGITSFDAIRLLRRVSGERKIGHTGTLDPLAQGVLPVFCGKMTKLIPQFNQADKIYRVSARLGARSSTLDREGVLEAVPIPSTCTVEAVRQWLAAAVGEKEQVPPMYSAVKIKGRRLYEYARKGKEVTRSPRKVVIHEVKNFEGVLPSFRFEVRCSKGTYIRTLVDDLGRALGTAAYVTELIRIRSGDGFSLDNALTLDQIKNLNKIDLQKRFIDPHYLLPDWHLVLIRIAKDCQFLCQGRTIDVSDTDIRFSTKGRAVTNALVKDRHNRLLATGRLEFSQDGPIRFHPARVFQ